MFKTELEKYNILKHDFYVAWDKGLLEKRDIQEYACQYFRHVDDTPRYLSRIHSICNNIKIRQVILDNLIDEEKGEENHPELWLKFAFHLGLKREEVLNAKLFSKTKELGETFMKLASKSVASGIGALYAYESQIPEVCKVKINSLEKYYDISSLEAIKFFSVHLEADVWHSQECADLIKTLSPEEQDEAKESALTLAEAFFKMFDAFEEMRLSKKYLNV